MEIAVESSSPTCSVVICAYNSRHRIETALRGLRAQNFAEKFEIIAVVSGDDGCAEHLAWHHPDVRVIRSQRRLYPGAARNAGVRASLGRFIAFVPDDCVAHPDWLRARMTKHRLGYPLVGGAISNATPKSIVGTAGYYVEYAASMPVERVLVRQSIPHTLSYRRDVFDQIGYFPEVEHPGEDTLFNVRCIAAGLEIAYEPRACVGHLNPTKIAAFLSHQAQHGRGLARCVAQGDLEGPFSSGNGLFRPAYVALVGYPAWRWRKTLSLIAATTPHDFVRFVGLTPLVIAGYFAAGVGALRELRSPTASVAARVRGGHDAP